MKVLKAQGKNQAGQAYLIVNKETFLPSHLFHSLAVTNSSTFLLRIAFYTMVPLIIMWCLESELQMAASNLVAGACLMTRVCFSQSSNLNLAPPTPLNYSETIMNSSEDLYQRSKLKFYLHHWLSANRLFEHTPSNRHLEFYLAVVCCGKRREFR